MQKTIHSDGWQRLLLRSRGLDFEVLESFGTTVAKTPEPIGITFSRCVEEPMLENLRSDILEVSTRDDLESLWYDFWRMRIDGGDSIAMGWIDAEVRDEQGRIGLYLIAHVRWQGAHVRRRVRVASLRHGELDRQLLNQMGWMARRYLDV